MNPEIPVKCKHCGRDMELIGFGAFGEIYECLKEDCGEGYEELNKEKT